MTSETKGPVLIVDDQPDLVTLLTATVQMMGLKVLSASNGLEALEVLKTVRPSLIVLDMNMPKMGGVEFYNTLVRRAGAGADRPEFPVLVLTARTNLESFFRDLQVDGFMTKPFEIADFVKEVEAILARSSELAGAGPVRVGLTPNQAVKKMSRRILILESREEVAKKIAGDFVVNGFTVTIENSGTAGIERAKRGGLDIILVNMNLSDLPGDLVAGRIRGYAVTGHLPVVLFAPKFSGTDRTILDEITHKVGAQAAVESDHPADLLMKCEQILKDLS